MPNNVRLRVLGNEETLGKSQGYLINYVMAFEISKKKLRKYEKLVKIEPSV